MWITKPLFTGIYAVFLLSSITCIEFPTKQEPAKISDSQAVLLDKNSLAINFAERDNYNDVTQNIGLPLHGANGTAIRWITNKNSRITDEGVVCRPPYGSGEDTVTLIAIISKGAENDVREFVLIVQENSSCEDVPIDKNTLKITYAPEDSAGSVTRSLGLPDRGINGSRITWTSSDPQRISINGYISRPDSSEEDAVVMLRATISKGVCIDSAMFRLTVIKKMGTLIDIDSNEYPMVKIGTQVWTGMNLRTTRFNDGSPIHLVEDSSAWVNLKTPGYCCFFNFCGTRGYDEDGALYNWYAVNSGKLAPPGWHVSTNADWDTLQNHLIANGYNWDGTRTGNKIAKSMASKYEVWHQITTTGTIGCDLAMNNSSGFSALPAGERYVDGNFSFNTFSGIWWSATEHDSTNAFIRILSFGYEDLIKHDDGLKGCGFSVRLVKD